MWFSKRLASLGVLVVAAFLAACGTKPSRATAQARGAQGKQYRFDVQAKPAKVGQTGVVSLIIQPAKGFHWNKEYPASLTLTPPGDGAVTLDRTDFDRAAFETQGTGAKLVIRFKGHKAGNTVLTGTANFSVCNDETCLLYRSEPVSIPVVVR